MGDIETSDVYPVVPPVGNFPTSRTRIHNNVMNLPSLQIDATLERGPLLGIMRPTWLKTTESEERLRWIVQMIGKNLLVRDIEAFLRTSSSKLRSDESKIREEERKVLKSLMILKRNDERRNLRSLKREKETVRRYVKENFGKKIYYDIGVKKLRKEVKQKRLELRKKYKCKLEHLEEIRRKEIAEKEKKKEDIPEELGFFRRCKIFDSERYMRINSLKHEDIAIGKVSLDKDEKAILRLNPNFAITKYLDEEEIKRDVELGLAKMRYEIRKRKEEKYLEEYDISEIRKKKMKKTDMATKMKERDKDIEDAKSKTHL